MHNLKSQHKILSLLLAVMLAVGMMPMMAVSAVDYAPGATVWDLGTQGPFSSRGKSGDWVITGTYDYNAAHFSGEDGHPAAVWIGNGLDAVIIKDVTINIPHRTTDTDDVSSGIYISTYGGTVSFMGTTTVNMNDDESDYGCWAMSVTNSDIANWENNEAKIILNAKGADTQALDVCDVHFDGVDITATQSADTWQRSGITVRWADGEPSSFDNGVLNTTGLMVSFQGGGFTLGENATMNSSGTVQTSAGRLEINGTLNATGFAPDRAEYVRESSGIALSNSSYADEMDPIVSLHVGATGKIVARGAQAQSGKASYGIYLERRSSGEVTAGQLTRDAGSSVLAYYGTGSSEPYGVGNSSGVQILGFADNDNAGAGPTITINTQPAASTTVTEDSISGNLTVAASVTGGNALAYQWYQNSSNSTTGGTALSGATSDILAIPNDLSSGVYYFYCVVSAQDAESKTSNVAKVIVEPAAPGELTSDAPAVDPDGGTITLDTSGVSTAYIRVSLGASSVASPGVAIPTAAEKADVTVEGDAVTVNPNTLTANGNIKVTAAKTGTATIKIAFTGGSVTDTSYDKSITVNVDGGTTTTPDPTPTTPTPSTPTYNNDDDDHDDNDSGSSSSYSGSSSTSTAFTGPSAVSSAAATTSVNSALAAALASGADTATARLTNPGDISLATLQAMANQAGDTPLKVNADSMNGNAVDVRITLDPSQATTALDLSASTVNPAAVTTTNHFERFYSNDLMTVALGQQGSFGMPVQVAAKLDPALNTENLVFYSYNPETNSYTAIAAPAYWIDANGYVHFTTTLGGNIIISDGELTR